MSKDDDVAEAFSLYAEDYDRWFDDPKGRTLFELEVKAIRLLMKDLVPPFLEIGVGSGRFAAALGIRNGVEPAEALLEMAKKRGVKVEKSIRREPSFSEWNLRRRLYTLHAVFCQRACKGHI